MDIILQVRLTVERTTGKFISREDLEDAVLQEVESNLPGTVEVDESEYEVVDSEVSVQAEAKKGGKEP